jgi:signal transduction histidine kinase/ActR/RegA family two-component response regulator
MVQIAAGMDIVGGLLMLSGMGPFIARTLNVFDHPLESGFERYIVFLLLGVALLLLNGGSRTLPYAASQSADSTSARTVTSTSMPEVWRHRVVDLCAVGMLIIAVAIVDLRVQTRLCFLLCAISVTCLNYGRRFVPWGQLVALIIFLEASAALVAYGYGLTFFFALGHWSVVRLTTALLLFPSAVGLFIASPAIGPAHILLSNGNAGSLSRRLLLPVAIGFPFLGFVGGIGEKHQLDLTVVLLAANIGLPLSIYTVARFIRQEESVRLLAYEQLEIANQKLNAQLADLLATQSSLSEALKVRQHFIAKVSHELRTPLAAILGATELAIDGKHTPEQLELLNTTEDAARSLLQLVNEILDFSAMEQSQIKLEHNCFNIRELIESSVKLFGPRAARKHLFFNAIIDDNVPQEMVNDPNRLRHVLMNLIDNAIKFCDKGEVSIKVGWTLHETGEFLHIEISDTGVGIPDDLKQFIFEPFRQADDSQTRRHSGTGLGLTVAKAIVTLMGGTIGVVRKPQVGSTFWLEVPNVVEQEKGAQKGAQKGAYSIASKASVFPPTAVIDRAKPILVVDDNKVNATILCLQLTKLGFTSHFVLSGQQALDALRCRDYLLVFMDWQMPDMDGIETTKLIRAMASSAASEVPIVALTAHAMPGDRQACLDAGMDAYLSKPASIDNIEQVLLKFSHQRHHAR